MEALGKLRRALIFSAALGLLLPPTPAKAQSYAVAKDKNLRGSAILVADPDDSGTTEDGLEDVKAAREVTAAGAEAAEAVSALQEAKQVLATRKIVEDELRTNAVEARQLQREALREQADLDAAVASADAKVKQTAKAANEAKARAEQAEKDAKIASDKWRAAQDKAAAQRSAEGDAAGESSTTSEVESVAAERERSAQRVADQYRATVKANDRGVREQFLANQEARSNLPYVEELESKVRDFEAAYVRAAGEAAAATVAVKRLTPVVVASMERARDAQEAWNKIIRLTEGQADEYRSIDALIHPIQRHPLQFHPL